MDGQQVGDADAVGNGAEIGIGADAAAEFETAIVAVDDLADQFDADLHLVLHALVPGAVIGAHLADKADDAGLSHADRDQPADRPEISGGADEAGGGRGNGGT